ncbi:SMP-30/gluconolactonase/LRE family protein [Pseudoalteromonas luteoviolacea]|uniref:SMP-30/gluconolactonase/LRE family protein n=1 Tax=Pseudoalteromonas luteoviolacea TaxID=43657 RepID=UPI001F1B09C7|nr:SMP-30/gluconolactonase/LRE family protein [Pseudoalteromonas luteoviolacea]MCF6441936.1 SMP-30/gluconolactonase/LRE family protein [Pseudoalteromonas luteoviolacea]
MKAILGTTLLIIGLGGCQSLNTPNEPLYQTQDWVADGEFTNGVEGPAVDARGVLYAVNYKEQGTIGQITAQNNASLYVKLPKGSIGNGIRFDKKGNMYIADYTQHNILQITPQKRIRVFAHEPTMNQPNDIAIADDGTLYASDPNWQGGNGQVWRISTTGQVERLKKDMGTTNGIEISPGNTVLYVNESVQQRIWAFDINKNGQLGEARLFYQFDDHGLDGMRTDERGNLYVARYGAGEVAILSPKGELLRTVKLKGKYPTNVAFGGKSGRQVFVTMQKRGAIESFYSEYAGRAMTSL